MRYGSIGWSVGATLGYALASGGSTRSRTLRADSASGSQISTPASCTPAAAMTTTAAAAAATLSHPGAGQFGIPGGAKRVLSLIGDGSFQMTAQEVSTMLRYRLTPVIILVWGG